MWLKKDKGGSGILWEGAEYEWPEAASVTEVPDRLGRELLAIPEGGFEKVDEPVPGKEITEGGEGAKPDAGPEGGDSAKPKRPAAGRKPAQE